MHTRIHNYAYFHNRYKLQTARIIFNEQAPTFETSDWLVRTPSLQLLVDEIHYDGLLLFLFLQLLVSGGGMYVEVFNRGVISLAYDIKKKNRAGETNIYTHGIYLLFTYFTKPESLAVLEETVKMDDNVIRSSTFKIRKRKY